MRSLVSNVVIMASMGRSFSVLSHVVTDPMCGCLDTIALCRPFSRSILVSFPVLTSSLASMPIIRCSPSSIHCFTAFRRSSMSASLGVRASSMVRSRRVCCLFTESAPCDVPMGLWTDTILVWCPFFPDSRIDVHLPSFSGSSLVDMVLWVASLRVVIIVPPGRYLPIFPSHTLCAVVTLPSLRDVTRSSWESYASNIAKLRPGSCPMSTSML